MIAKRSRGEVSFCDAGSILCIQSIIQSRDSTPQEVFLGKAGSFSQKQVWTCLVKTGNDLAIFQGHDSHMIYIDQLKTSP